MYRALDVGYGVRGGCVGGCRSPPGRDSCLRGGWGGGVLHPQYSRRRVVTAGLLCIWSSRKPVSHRTNDRVMVHGDGTRADARRSGSGAPISQDPVVASPTRRAEHLWVSGGGGRDPPPRALYKIPLMAHLLRTTPGVYARRLRQTPPPPPPPARRPAAATKSSIYISNLTNKRHQTNRGSPAR